MIQSLSFFAGKIARPALLVGALALPLGVLITGCGGGGSNNKSSTPATPTPLPTIGPIDIDPTSTPAPTATPDPALAATTANITFSNTGSTTANTAPINLNGPVNTVTASNTGVHAGLSSFAPFTEFHILALAKSGSASSNPRRTLDIELRPATRAEATNPVAGTPYTFTPTDLGLNTRLSKIYYVDNNKIWVTNSGSATITTVTDTAYSLTLNNVEMILFDPVNGAVPTDTFTLNGTTRIQKNNIVIEAQSDYRNHQFGIVSASDAPSASSAFLEAIGKG